MPDPRKKMRNMMRPVITILPPPEIHLLIGPVNMLYDALNNAWLESERWLQSCNVKKTVYHGRSFAGNDSMALLKNSQILEDISPESCMLMHSSVLIKL